MVAVPWMLGALLLSTLVAGIRANAGVGKVECYSCVSLVGEQGQASCSDPWKSWRHTLNSLTGPPKRPCQDACVKIVIFNKDSSNSVVRTCGEMCNETLAGDTLTTCCQENLCNSARTNTRGTPETILSVVLMFAGVSVLADIIIWR